MLSTDKEPKYPAKNPYTRQGTLDPDGVPFCMCKHCGFSWSIVVAWIYALMSPLSKVENKVSCLVNVNHSVTLSNCHDGPFNLSNCHNRPLNISHCRDRAVNLSHCYDRAVNLSHCHSRGLWSMPLPWAQCMHCYSSLTACLYCKTTAATACLVKDSCHWEWFMSHCKYMLH